jgi:CubicO group peptidase (beta-lactamase class C family)
MFSMPRLTLATVPAALRAIPALRVLPALVMLPTLALPGGARGQTPGYASRVDAIFADWNSETSPGCAVGVTRYGETVLERAWGMADLEHAVANTPETIFEGGSVSKQFTAAAIVLLVLDGALTLDDDIRDYVPEVPDYGSTITLRHLMTHTSGLRDWGSVAAISGWGREQRSHDHDDVIDILSRQTALNFEPGHEYSYSNSGYNLLAVVVARTSGMSFADFSTSRIFEPLGMTHTQWRDDYRRIVPGRSSAYDRTGDGWEINRPIENVHGNGGILTTVRDLGVWNGALSDGRLGGTEFVRLMHTQGHLNDGTEISYAAGLQVGTFAGVSSVTHTGSTAGYRAFLARYPEQQLSVAMLCNASNVATGGTGGRVARIFLGPAAVEADPPDFESGSRGYALDTYAGLYREPITGAPIRIAVSQGVLRARGAPLLPLSQTDFQFGSSTRRLIFSRDGQSVTGFRVEDGESFDRRYDRVPEWTPSPTELADFTGTFRSEEAETTLVVSVEDGALELWQRPNDTRTYAPVYSDAFQARGSTVVRFRRDDEGHVIGLSLSLGRVYDMHFARIERRGPEGD